MGAQRKSFGSCVTAIVLTYNEEQNIERTLAKLDWVREVIVVDSGSSDHTVPLACGFENVRVIERTFDTFSGQCNHGLTQVKTDWVLSLDADYVLGDRLVCSMSNLTPEENTVGYRCAFRYLIDGAPLRASLYPPRVVLYRKKGARYHDEGHGHRLKIVGKIVTFKERIDHDDRKPFDRWMQNQLVYARREAHYLLKHDRVSRSNADQVRLSGWILPLLIVPYVLLWKGCILDGRIGWRYALERLLSETAIALELARLRAQMPKIGEISERKTE